MATGDNKTNSAGFTTAAAATLILAAPVLDQVIQSIGSSGRPLEGIVSGSSAHAMSKARKIGDVTHTYYPIYTVAPQDATHTGMVEVSVGPGLLQVRGDGGGATESRYWPNAASIDEVAFEQFKPAIPNSANQNASADGSKTFDWLNPPIDGDNNFRWHTLDRPVESFEFDGVTYIAMNWVLAADKSPHGEQFSSVYVVQKFDTKTGARLGIAQVYNPGQNQFGPPNEPENSFFVDKGNNTLYKVVRGYNNLAGSGVEGLYFVPVNDVSGVNIVGGLGKGGKTDAVFVDSTGWKKRTLSDDSETGNIPYMLLTKKDGTKIGNDISGYEIAEDGDGIMLIAREGVSLDSLGFTANAITDYNGSQAIHLSTNLIQSATTFVETPSIVDVVNGYYFLDRGDATHPAIDSGKSRAANFNGSLNHISGSQIKPQPMRDYNVRRA